MRQLYKASIVLEDGKIFNGYASKKFEHIGEIVFTTSMTGYQKALTDPSYHDQILVMTYPLQGNYGTNEDLFHYDNESPSNKMKLNPFTLNIDFVSNNQWKEFIESNGYKLKERMIAPQMYDLEIYR